MRRIPVLALLALTSSACATLAPAGGRAPAPCVQAVAACEQWMPIPRGSARTKVYASYPLAVPNASITRALIMVHGAGRNADHYFETSMAAAFLAGALENTMVLSPRFAQGTDTVAANELLWPNLAGNWRAGGPIDSTTNYGSFNLLDDMLRKLADKRVFPNLTKVVIAGHSAGGQVATRYAMTNRVHGTLGGVDVRYVVSNPSTYAWPSALRPLPVGNADTTDAYKEALGPNGEKVNLNFTFGRFDASKVPGFNRWPAGLENRSFYSRDLSDDVLRRQLAERPTWYLLGQTDVLPLAGFDSSPTAMAQGPTRRARGEAFYKFVTDTLGAKHTAMIVSQCGHNARCVFTTDAVLPVIFP